MTASPSTARGVLPTFPAVAFGEVKNATSPGSDFLITENERQVFSNLGDKAWLYRVVVEADGGGEVVSTLQDPIRHIGPGHLTPVVWRVASEALES